MIELHIPPDIRFTSTHIEKMISLNPGLSLELTDSSIRISEGELQFFSQDFLRLWMPFDMQEEVLFKIDELNQYLTRLSC